MVPLFYSTWKQFPQWKRRQLLVPARRERREDCFSCSDWFRNPDLFLTCTPRPLIFTPRIKVLRLKRNFDGLFISTGPVSHTERIFFRLLPSLPFFLSPLAVFPIVGSRLPPAGLIGEIRFPFIPPPPTLESSWISLPMRLVRPDPVIGEGFSLPDLTQMSFCVPFPLLPYSFYVFRVSERCWAGNLGFLR